MIDDVYDDVMDADAVVDVAGLLGAGMSVWKYRFKGTKNFSVSCWKYVRRASFASTSFQSQRMSRQSV